MEREFVLRRFNKDFLNMEVSVGSAFNRIVGVGERHNPETGKMDKVFDFYPSIFRNVVRAFEIYPINKYFGLKVSDAMNMPFDQWQEIVENGKRLAQADADKEAAKPDSEARIMELLKELLIGRGEGA